MGGKGQKLDKKITNKFIIVFKNSVEFYFAPVKLVIVYSLSSDDPIKQIEWIQPESRECNLLSYWFLSGYRFNNSIGEGERRESSKI